MSRFFTTRTTGLSGRQWNILPKVAPPQTLPHISQVAIVRLLVTIAPKGVSCCQILKEREVAFKVAIGSSKFFENFFTLPR